MAMQDFIVRVIQCAVGKRLGSPLAGYLGLEFAEEDRVRQIELVLENGGPGVAVRIVMDLVHAALR